MENGYNIYGPIIPYADEDNYPTHLAKYGKGGFVSLDDITSKDEINIPEERLEEGMLVYIVNDKDNIFFYQYLNGEWTRAKLPNNISISTDLETFKNNSAEGDITIYDNKFYYKDSEGNVSILPVYEFKELEDGFSYNSTFADENDNLVENSSIVFSISGEEKKLNIDSSVKISIGDKVITQEESENSVSLPSDNGVLALTSDISSAVDPVSEKVENLIKSTTIDEASIKALQEEVFEDSSNYTSNYIHINPLKKTNDDGSTSIIDFDEEFKLLFEDNDNHIIPYAKFLKIELGDTFKNNIETSEKTASFFLLISGKLTGSKTTHIFTDIVSISNRGKRIGGWEVKHLNDVSGKVNDKFNLILYDHFLVYKSHTSSKATWTNRGSGGNYINLVTIPGVSLDIKVIGKNFSDDEFKLIWYTDPLNEPGHRNNRGQEYIGLPSFTDSSVSIEISNSYNQQNAITTTINLGTETETETTTIGLNLDYNTFILDCENTLHSTTQDALIFNITNLPSDPEGVLSSEELLYNSVLRFVFSSTKKEGTTGFDYFKITNKDGVTVLDLSGLGMEDGESIYVTPIRSSDSSTETWSYFRESSFPKHDNTLVVKQDENSELRLGVNEETVSSQEKLYIVNYDNLINVESGVSVKLSNSSENDLVLVINKVKTPVISIDLFLPKDASIVDIRLKDLVYYLKEVGLSDDLNKIIALHGIRRLNDGLFQENKKIDVIIDFASPMDNGTGIITETEDSINVDKFIIHYSVTEEIVVGHGYNGYFVCPYRYPADLDSDFIDNLFGFNNAWIISDNDAAIDEYNEENYMVIEKSQVPNYRHHFQLISLYSNKTFNGSTISRFQHWGVIDTSTYFTSDDYYSEELETLNNLKTSLE